MADLTTVGAIAVPLAAYLMGSILPAELLARRRGIHLRQTGGNPGAAEAGRLFGRAAGIGVYVLDAAKGVVPLAAGRWLSIPWWAMAAAAILAVAGHNWSIYYRFWGGKGLATASGVCAFMLPTVMAIALPPSLFAWWFTGWIPASGMIGFPMILALAWLHTTDPGGQIVATAVPFVVLARQGPWIRARLAVGPEKVGQPDGAYRTPD